MKRIIWYGILIFIFSFGIGFYYSMVWKNGSEEISKSQEIVNDIEKNENIVETFQTEEKVSYDASFALKKYYDECDHFTFQYSELPKEIINLTKTELEELYDEWEVEEFSSNHVVLSQELNSICEEHYLVKLGESNIEIYNLGNNGTLNLYRETDIGREYLTSEDISSLEKGIVVYGKGKLNSTIEDFE